MNTPALSQELALRIGMAARVLPDMDPRRLMTLLATVVGTPFTEQKLGQLTVAQLRSAGDGALQAVALPDMKRALDFLWGKARVEISDERPPVQPYADGDMPNSIRVAIASNGGERLDGHFGTCVRFLIYQVSPQEIRLIDVRNAEAAGDQDDKNTWRARLIGDCHLLYVVSIGGPAAAKVVKQDVHPIKQPHGGDAHTILEETQAMLASSPPPWLAKVMGRHRAAVLRGEDG